MMAWIRIAALATLLCSAHVYAEDHGASAVTETGGKAVIAPPTVDLDHQEDLKAAYLIGHGASLVRSGVRVEAIQDFDSVIQSFESRYHDPKVQYFSARTAPEALLYAMEGANAKVATKVVSAYWGLAYDLKAYALTDLGRQAEALMALQKAVALSPMNAQYLAELGYYYETQKNWPLALAQFQAAAEAAKPFSPDNARVTDLTRAWRGIAYVYVEQGRLDDAEKLYRQCLELDKNDMKSQGELGYIQKLRAKQ